MTTQELELAIRDIIKELYCVEYQGVLKVEETFYQFPGEPPEHSGYKLSIGLNKMAEKPLTIAFDGPANVFLQFIKKELLSRNFTHVSYFTAIQLYDYEDECKEK